MLLLCSYRIGFIIKRDYIKYVKSTFGENGNNATKFSSGKSLPSEITTHSSLKNAVSNAEINRTAENNENQHLKTIITLTNQKSDDSRGIVIEKNIKVARQKGPWSGYFAVLILLGIVSFAYPRQFANHFTFLSGNIDFYLNIFSIVIFILYWMGVSLYRRLQGWGFRWLTHYDKNTMPSKQRIFMVQGFTWLTIGLIHFVPFYTIVDSSKLLNDYFQNNPDAFTNYTAFINLIVAYELIIIKYMYWVVPAILIVDVLLYLFISLVFSALILPSKIYESFRSLLVPTLLLLILYLPPIVLFAFLGAKGYEAGSEVERKYQEGVTSVNSRANKANSVAA